MKIAAIITRSPFNELFSINPAVLENIEQAMTEAGYDHSQPIIVWEGENVVVDGHTRLQAAREVGLEDIPVYLKNFENEDAALIYAIHNQRNRRNLTDAEILRCIEAMDKRKTKKEVSITKQRENNTGKFSPQASSEASGKSAQKTAATAWMHAGFSGWSIGGMNTTTDNQSTHCLLAQSFMNLLIFRDNLALLTAFCPQECGGDPRG